MFVYTSLGFAYYIETCTMIYRDNKIVIILNAPETFRFWKPCHFFKNLVRGGRGEHVENAGLLKFNFWDKIQIEPKVLKYN